MSKFVDEPTDNLQNLLEKKNQLDLRVFFISFRSNDLFMAFLKFFPPFLLYKIISCVPFIFTAIILFGRTVSFIKINQKFMQCVLNDIVSIERILFM